MRLSLFVGYIGEKGIRNFIQHEEFSDEKTKRHYGLVLYGNIGITQSVISISRQDDRIGAEFGENIIAHGSVAAIRYHFSESQWLFFCAASYFICA